MVIIKNKSKFIHNCFCYVIRVIYGKIYLTDVKDMSKIATSLEDDPTTASYLVPLGRNEPQCNNSG